MRLTQITLLCISCSVISAQRNIDLLRRQLQLTYDDEIQLGMPLVPRYGGLLDDFDFEMQELLRRDLFRVLREMSAKKDKEKAGGGGGGDNNSEGGSGGGDSPKEKDSASSESEESCEDASDESDSDPTFDDFTDSNDDSGSE